MNNNIKNIAIFANDLGVGGIQKSLYNLLKNLDYNKYNIDLYLMNQNNFYNDSIPRNVNIIYLKKHSKLINFIPFKINYKLHKYEGQNKEYDISIDYDGYKQYTAINALKCKAKKYIMWIHNDFLEKSKYEYKFRILNFFSKKKNKLFTHYVGVSKGVIDSFKKYNQIAELNYEIIPNIIDTNEIISKANEPCDLIVGDKYNFCSIGRLIKQKGFDILINKLKELTKYRTDFHFYLIGDGKELNNLKKQVIEIKLEQYITFLGAQKNPYKYINLMDGFILTSRYEGQGMVLMEAKTLGLELFISKNLEKYNEGIIGREDIVNDLIKATKKIKKIDKLEEYNQNIIIKLDKLFIIE